MDINSTAIGGPFTQLPGHHATAVFPTPGMQALACCLFMIGIILLTFCLARRTHGLSLKPSSWSGMSWARVCVVLVFVDSLLFLFSSGVLVLGVGMSFSSTTCELGIFLCIVFYATSKIFIYCFLIEKVHIVSATATPKPRLSSRLYKLCLAILTPYLVVALLMIIGRVSHLRSDGACVIGLTQLGSIPILTYDIFINVFLTSLFLIPLFRSGFASPVLRKVALRTLIGAFCALGTSAVNILILILMRGHQLGWVCLGACGADVVLNTLVLFYVTYNPAPTLTLPSSHPNGDAFKSPEARSSVQAGSISIPNDFDYLPTAQHPAPLPRAKIVRPGTANQAVTNRSIGVRSPTRRKKRGTGTWDTVRGLWKAGGGKANDDMEAGGRSIQLEISVTQDISRTEHVLLDDDRDVQRTLRSADGTPNTPSLVTGTSRSSSSTFNHKDGAPFSDLKD